jgi:putative flippase GtrA
MRQLIARFLGDERVRFVLIGGINTVVGYGLFAAFQLAIGHVIGYLGSLYVSYAFATILAFTLHRRFTFRASRSGSIVVDFLRFQSVYVVSLVINTIALPLLVEVGHLVPLVAQACVIVVTTVISYVGHKWFSFRRPKVGVGPDTVPPLILPIATNDAEGRSRAQ